MEPISVDKKEETPDGWRFVVEIGPDHNKIGFSVLLCRNYWLALTGGSYPPEELLVRSLHLFLQHDSKTSMARSFHLGELQQHA